MLHLFMNSGLVLIMLCSECSFMRHKNKIVVLKHRRYVCPPSPAPEGTSGKFLPIHGSGVCGWNSNPAEGHAVTLGERAPVGGREGQLTRLGPRHH